MPYFLKYRHIDKFLKSGTEALRIPHDKLTGLKQLAQLHGYSIGSITTVQEYKQALMLCFDNIQQTAIRDFLDTCFINELDPGRQDLVPLCNQSKLDTDQVIVLLDLIDLPLDIFPKQPE